MFARLNTVCEVYIWQLFIRVPERVVHEFIQYLAFFAEVLIVFDYFFGVFFRKCETAGGAYWAGQSAEWLMSALADKFANRFSVSSVDFQNMSNLSMCSRNLLGFVVVRFATSSAQTAQPNSWQQHRH